MQRDINFFSAYRSPIESGTGVDKVMVMGLSLLGVCIIGISALYASIRVTDNLNAAKIAQIQQYLQSKDVISAQSTLNDLTQELTALRNYQNTASAEISAFNQQPVLDSKTLEEAAAKMPADVNTQKIDYSSGTLTLSCTATDKLSPANFVHSLKAANIFSDVSYTGVTYNNDTKTYSFTVACRLKGGAAK